MARSPDDVLGIDSAASIGKHLPTEPLDDLEGRVRDQVAAIPLRGTVTRVTDRGFGFLTPQSGQRDIFFHARELLDVESNVSIVGNSVEFDMIEGPKGPVAANVNVVSDDTETEEEFEVEAVVDETIKSSVVQAVDALTKQLIMLISENPYELKFVEWRTMERIVAEVFEGLGFSVVLTEGSNDEGKDVIVSTNVEGVEKTYLVEVKHWTSGQRVGGKIIRSFLQIIAHEGAEGGLILASSGFGKHAFESITEIDQGLISAGDGTKIVDLCQMYRKSRNSVWLPTMGLHEIIFEDTLIRKTT
jgi:cold shock CspA family protein